jgi:hypothetical protein
MSNKINKIDLDACFKNNILLLLAEKKQYKVNTILH